MPQMRICIVSMNIVPYFTRDASVHYGGAEVQAAALAGGFRRAGAEVVLAVADLHAGRTLPFPAENAFFTDRGVPALRFITPRLTGILSALERARADVYYQHCAGMITGLTALFCRRNGKVFVYGAGSNTDFSLWGSRVRGLRDKVLFHTGLKLAHGIVAQNRTQQELCFKAIGKSPVVLPMVVSFDEHESAHAGSTIMWVGAMRGVKRPELFVELAARLPEKRFVMVGGTVAAEPGVMERIRKQAGGVRNIEITGRLPHHEVLELLKDAALLVNTSSVEGFPNVYLEAWNRGVPVVSFTDVDGMIAAEGAGTICADFEDMVRAVGALMDDPAKRSLAGGRGRDIVRTRYASHVVAGEYVRYFETLLGGCRRGAE
ncbi:MAG: glycosyltransferase family 4 protein [Chitinivibrionia bacterium]|nr:glycosyltransferase family 4 protein [Chitinivibrionia bacterium]